MKIEANAGIELTKIDNGKLFTYDGEYYIKGYDPIRCSCPWVDCINVTSGEVSTFPRETMVTAVNAKIVLL